MASGQVNDLIVRVDDWLPEMLGGWPTLAPAQRHRTLRDLFGLAERYGLEIEVDWALFAWIMLANGPDWQRFHQRADVQDVLTDPEWNAGSRIVALQDLAMPDGALHQ